MAAVGSNLFDLNHDVKMSFNMGQLVPSCIMEVMPGDKFKIGVEQMLRFQPLASPMMHTCNVTTHYFFVPNRILWSGWEDFITGESDDVHPYFAFSGDNTANPGSLGDYLGIPQVDEAQLQISALPIAAYFKIYDEYYRDQNLQPEQFVELTAGNNSSSYEAKAMAAPLKRAWMHDYFTSCLPFAQKGDEVTLPLLNNDTADVDYKSGLTSNDNQTFRSAATDLPLDNFLRGDAVDGTLENSGSIEGRLDIGGTHEVDINAESSTINDLRRAFKIQEWLEKNARGGTRYIENILAHFGVKSSDHRLQRPEYIGGTKGRMTISEVLSTAQTVDQSSNDVPVGDLKGHGVSVSGGNTWKYRAEEHGFIIGITNVQPVTAYQQGLHRMFSRRDKFDYAWPTFANIGEQAVLNKELNAEVLDPVVLDGTFGYIPRYAEYKYMNNRVAGDFKDTLAFWHLSRQFSGVPTLNSDFIECDPDHRVFAVTDPTEHKVLGHIFNNVRVIRKLPKYGIPTI